MASLSGRKTPPDRNHDDTLRLRPVILWDAIVRVRSSLTMTSESPSRLSSSLDVSANAVVAIKQPTAMNVSIFICLSRHRFSAIAVSIRRPARLSGIDSR
jgi:hypothetical protein